MVWGIRSLLDLLPGHCMASWSHVWWVKGTVVRCQGMVIRCGRCQEIMYEDVEDTILTCKRNRPAVHLMLQHHDDAAGNH